MFGIDDAIAVGLKVLDKFVPDPEARAKAEKTLRSDLAAWDAAQMAVNAAEAAHTSVFVAGWRPMIGWACALALIIQYLAGPLAVWIGDLTGNPLPAPPKLDAVLWELMFGMLGMGGLRTYEKLKGVARINME